MNLELVINAKANEVDIAYLKDKVLTELHKEKGSQDFAVGDVYLGKVHRVIPSLNAAFVDVGYEKDAFLHYLDLGPQYRSMNKFVKRTLAGKQESADLTKFPTEDDIDKNGKINDVVSGSQHILVQVAKEPISSKGPRLTSEITLAGRYIVLVPFGDKISLSQRIKNVEERTRLRRLLQSIKPKNFGVIVRTVAENKKVAELDADLRDLHNRWKKIHENLKTAKPPKRVLGELNKTSTVLRDLLSASFTSIHVNDNQIAEEIKDYLRKVAPTQENIVKLHNKEDLFETFGVNRQIKSAFGKQVNLKSGAYLIIEHTEAMHVIDVNSGSRKGGERGQEQNALETNLECAEEIARVLRLRDMGGIIAVDFIDMGQRSHQKQLYEKLRECLKDDKAKHNVLPPSRFGVVEITRQRVREVTDISTEEKCPCCEGSGSIQASVLITDQIENNLRYIVEEFKTKRIVLKTHPFIAAYLKAGLISTRRRWSMKYKVNLKVQEDQDSSYLNFKFFNEKGEPID
ncbi:Rne/Rng family ribonuclease [Cryomorpha ignava]|uniref:Rne/Rng family ribonuclease n=1 Tax=Cryomorpha ignava TaxID=101383 RepID=A0A7K3WRC4_9FLAO|nr:Rne/Rng family ribonuclease [Cryomorpha ignava]NEN23392.1 Rne/Rng family ribonuclease [Cryomorpha ignava]